MAHGKRERTKGWRKNPWMVDQKIHPKPPRCEKCNKELPLSFSGRKELEAGKTLQCQFCNHLHYFKGGKRVRNKSFQ